MYSNVFGHIWLLGDLTDPSVVIVIRFRDEQINLQACKQVLVGIQQIRQYLLWRLEMFMMWRYCLRDICRLQSCCRRNDFLLFVLGRRKWHTKITFHNLLSMTHVSLTVNCTKCTLSMLSPPLKEWKCRNISKNELEKWPWKYCRNCSPKPAWGVDVDMRSLTRHVKVELGIW